MSLKKNIIALYLIKVSKWFTLVMPIIVLFYKECGLDLADIFILKSVYSIAMVSLEIPTGYLADVWGRRNCLIAGCIFCFLGFTNYSISDTFTAFFLSEILLGFGQSLVSGADSALLYDTMLHYKKEDEYLKYEGRVTMVGNFSEAFAGIFSGLLAVYSLRLPFYVQSGIAFIGIPAAVALTEHAAKTRIKNSFANIVQIIQYSLFTNKELCYNIMFSGVIGAATLTMAWFVQPLLIGDLGLILRQTGSTSGKFADVHVNPVLHRGGIYCSGLQYFLYWLGMPVLLLHRERIRHTDIKRIH